MLLLFVQFELKMTVHAAPTKKKVCEANNFWYLFKEELISFWHFFQEELASALSARKPFSDNLEG